MFHQKLDLNGTWYVIFVWKKDLPLGNTMLTWISPWTYEHFWNPFVHNVQKKIPIFLNRDEPSQQLLGRWSSPSVLCELLVPYVPARSLRSSSATLHVVPLEHQHMVTVLLSSGTHAMERALTLFQLQNQFRILRDY